jgi:sulfur carrier protein
MTQIKKIYLNGEKYSTDQNLTLFDLLVYFNYDNYLLVLEYNNLILNRTDWKTTFIKNSDKIEIVTIVGGG